MVVIAIIGMLTAIITVSLSSAKQKSRDSKRLADIKSIQLALSLYYNDNGFYPKNIYSSSYTTAGSDPTNGLTPAYLSVVPKDPNANASDDCTNSSAVNGYASCYHYTPYYSSNVVCASISTSPPIIYHLGASMEDKTNAGLLQDRDAASSLNPPYSTTYYAYGAGCPAAFDGNAATCVNTTAASPDPCYDVTP